MLRISQSFTSTRTAEHRKWPGAVVSTVVYPTACSSIGNGVLKFRQNNCVEKDLNARLIKFSIIKSSQRYTMAKKARIMRIRMVNGMRIIWEQRLPTKELIEKLKSKGVIYPFLL